MAAGVGAQVKTDPMPVLRALVRRPGPRLAEGIVTHASGGPVDVALAHRQWAEYVRTLQDAGWQTLEVEPADDQPDAVFVEDTLVVYGDLAVLTRPGAPGRRGELPAVAEAAAEAGYRVARIEAPGTLDGGDVLKFGGTVRVGRSARTDDDGIRQLAALLEPMGALVVPVPVRSVLHLKSAVTALPDGTLVGHPPLLDHPFDDLLPVPEPSGGQVVLLEHGTVLLAASAPRTAELLRRRGHRVVTVDISELEKLDGGVTCLSVRLRDEGAAAGARS